MSPLRRSTYVPMAKPLAAIVFWAWFKKPNHPAARVVRKLVYRTLRKYTEQIGK